MVDLQVIMERQGYNEVSASQVQRRVHWIFARTLSVVHRKQSHEPEDVHVVFSRPSQESRREEAGSEDQVVYNESSLLVCFAAFLRRLTI